MRAGGLRANENGRQIFPPVSPSLALNWVALELRDVTRRGVQKAIVFFFFFAGCLELPPVPSSARGRACLRSSARLSLPSTLALIAFHLFPFISFFREWKREKRRRRNCPVRPFWAIFQSPFFLAFVHCNTQLSSAPPPLAPPLGDSENKDGFSSLKDLLLSLSMGYVCAKRELAPDPAGLKEIPSSLSLMMSCAERAPRRRRRP